MFGETTIFSCKGLESSNWNNHFKVDVSGTRLINFFSNLKDAVSDCEIAEIYSEQEEDERLARDIIGLGIAFTLFGPKVVISGFSGLPANEASKFGNEAKLAMTWARRVYETHRNTISGMTGNSVAAAMPELALIFASQNGATGRQTILRRWLDV